jgi:hypothetical protein
MPRRALPVMLVSLLIAPAGAFAQDQGTFPRPTVQIRPRPVERPNPEFVILMRDGTRVAGDVISSTPDRIVVRTPTGIRIVPRSEIVRTEAARQQARKAAKAIGGKVASSFREPLKGGETRFGLFPMVQHGVTNQISIGVTPLILPHGFAAILMTGQLSIPRPNGTIYTAGLLHAERFDRGRLGFVHGNVTKRSEHGSVTAGLLVPYIQTQDFGGSLVFFRLGGGHTVGRSGYRVNADAIASVRAGILTTTVGRTAGNVGWSAGAMTLFRDGHVKRVIPVFNLGVRF